MPDDETIVVTKKGMVVRSPIQDVRQTGRSTQGVRFISINKDDEVSSVANVVTKEE